MTRRDLPPEVLARRAIVYVRQSTSAQVQENLESQRQQYELADLARAYGFHDVIVIDDDLGRSASGTIDLVSASSSARSAKVGSVRSSASKPPASRAMDASGIT